MFASRNQIQQFVSMGKSASKMFIPSLKEGNSQWRGQFVYFQEHICNNAQLFVIGNQLLDSLIHRSMVALTFMDTNKKFKTGSGVLISRNIVLTAAHHIYNKQLKTENTGFKIYVGANGVAQEYHQVEGWRYPEEFKTCPSNAQLPHDYAIMKLKQYIDFQQYLPLSIACSECLLRFNSKKKLKIYGFPLYMGNYRSLNPQNQQDKTIKLNQYGLAEKQKIIDINTSQLKICYNISTLPGQSGCPVVMDNKIIALHLSGDKEQFNVGRIVDAIFIELLKKWREELNAAAFQLNSHDVCRHVQQTLQKMRYKLDLSQKMLKSVDLHDYSNLLELDLLDNQLRQIDISNCICLKILDLGNNHLQQIDLANNKHLTWLNMWNNQLKEIDVKANVNLTHLGLSSNRISEMDLTKNNKLMSLLFKENALRRVRLWITENVQAWRYTGFDISNQQSAVCRVQLQCEGQGQDVRGKAIRIVDAWMHKYSDYRYLYNKHNCAYSFLTY